MKTHKTFALIGAAGYVAPRHMKAIKDVGGELVAALDPHDSVGILDSFAPECLYFREPERFDRWLSKNHVDYVVVASPNYLHDSHSLMAMRNGADVICEKPLVCNERNLDNLAEWEVKTGKKVNAILQCRLHENVIGTHAKLSQQIKYNVMVDYNTPRGEWYRHSWKNDIEKSGGIPTNIGVHLFDLCCFVFGQYESLGFSHENEGIVYYNRATLTWRLSINKSEKPKRVFTITNPDTDWSTVIDLTSGFNDLHTKSYQEILAGRGFGIEDARPAIRIVEEIRNACQQ